MLSPRENLNLFGHTHAQSVFLEAFHSPRFPHAWILSGDYGIGKATFAFHMARYILSGRTSRDTTFSEEDPLHHRFIAHSQGDLLTLGEDGEGEVNVEAVRHINSTLTHTAREGGWRVVIVDGAERLNRNAANALLKRLEEPPAKTLFLLVTSLPGNLLATLRSRCQFLPLFPLSEPQVTAVLKAQHLTVKDPFSLAHGSPGRLIRFMENGGAEIYTELQTILKGSNPASFIQKHAENQISYDLIEDLLRTFLYNALITNINKTETVSSMLKTYETVDSLFTQCRFAQLDKRATLACILAEMTQ